VLSNLPAAGLRVELERLGLAFPDPPRLGVPGVHDLQLSVGEVQAHREGGDELRAAELLQELLVGGGDLLVGAAAGAADVAHDRGREAGEQARADAVAHRVQAGQVQLVGVDVVVQAVPAHLVGGMS